MSFQNIMIELRAEYLKTFPEKIVMMRYNLSKNHIKELELEFHKMKGTGATYGIPEISVIGERMEACCVSHPQLLKVFVPTICNIIELIIESRNQNLEFNLSEFKDYQDLVKKIS